MKIFNWIVIFHVSFPFKTKSRGLDVWEILVVLNGVLPFKVSTTINDFWTLLFIFPLIWDLTVEKLRSGGFLLDS